MGSKESSEQFDIGDLHGKPLKITLGESFRDSRVEVNGKELPVYGIDLRCDGGEHVGITLEVAGNHLEEPIVVRGTLIVESYDDLSGGEWVTKTPPPPQTERGSEHDE